MPIETELEHRLRSDLRSRQDDAPVLPFDLADVVRRRHRRERRAQLLTAAAGVAVVALVAGGATLRGDRTPDSASDTASTPSATRAEGILDWPTRGSLYDDAEWVDGVRRLDWGVPAGLADELPDPAVEDRHVAYAGDVPGGRVALVVGRDGVRTGAVWFTGPGDAGPGAMTPVNLPQSVSWTSPVALVRPGVPALPGPLLVAVGPPGASMDVTGPLVVDAAGEETQTRTELDSGVAVAALDAPWSTSSELRVHPSTGQPWQRVTSVVVVGGTAPPVGQGPLTQEALVTGTVGVLLEQYALSADEAQPTVLARDGSDTEGTVLLGMTFPSGATGAWVLRYEFSESGRGTSSVGRLPYAPAGPALEERLVAAHVDGSQLLLHAPDGAVRAEVLTTRGTPIGEVDLTGGSYVGPVPGGSFAGTEGAATVRALDAAGRTVAEEPIGRVVAS